MELMQNGRLERTLTDDSSASDSSLKPNTMATYSQENFERIATAIGKDVIDVLRHEKSFDAAAAWYRLDYRAPKAPDGIVRVNWLEPPGEDP